MCTANPTGLRRLAPKPPVQSASLIPKNERSSDTFGVLLLTGTAIVFALFVAACAALLSPALTPDLAKEESCIQAAVEQGVTNPTSIAITCSGAEEQFVIDFIAALMSGQWGKDHPTLVPGLRASLATRAFRSSDGGK
jgi:hypothetical protein